MYDLVSKHIERIDLQMAQNNISVTGTGDGIKQTQTPQKRHHPRPSSSSLYGTRSLSYDTDILSAAYSTLPQETAGDFRNSLQWDDGN